jgi:hypothetical protein
MKSPFMFRCFPGIAVLPAKILRILFAVIFMSMQGVSFASEGILAAGTELTEEQLRNYYDHDIRIKRIIDIAFPDISGQDKVSWRMLLLGTVATETNFLDRYSGRSRNGNGPYQIIGDTAHGIIHRYITYPLRGTDIIARRTGLMELFEKTTNGRIAWDELYSMDKEQLIELCVLDYDFAALMSLLVYKEAFGRNNINEILPEPAYLAKLWKEYYNTHLGVGTEKRFIERFMSVLPYIA